MKKLLLLITCLLTLSLTAETENKAILSAQVELLPSQISNNNPKIIQPGIPITVAVKISNTGTESSEVGIFFVRFAYPQELRDKPQSELFVTEKISLPSIAPGKEASIIFNKQQPTPSLFDFIRQDYGMRQYQAVAVIENKEYIIGNETLTFSAHYYQGPASEINLAVPSKVVHSQATP